VVISQGDVWWATLDDPVGSSPGFRRRVAIVQGDSFNASRLATTVVVPLTSNLRLAAAPGNVVLTAAAHRAAERLCRLGAGRERDRRGAVRGDFNLDERIGEIRMPPGAAPGHPRW